MGYIYNTLAIKTTVFMKQVMMYLHFLYLNFHFLYLNFHNFRKQLCILIEIILIITIFFYMIVNYMKEEFVSPFLWILILSTTPNLKKSESL